MALERESKDLAVGSAGQPVRFLVGERGGEVSGLLVVPKDASSLLVLAHGAGAGMRHKFMQEICDRLCAQGVATLRYQFPYMEKRSKRPDSEAVLTAAVRSAVGAAREHAGNLPLFAGGKSMGGRMTSIAAAQAPLEQVRGLIFLGFPLHAAGRPSAERGKHLSRVTIPMLFVQGSRDTLADLKFLKPLGNGLGNRAELFVVEGGDHSFHVLKSSGRSDDRVLDEVAQKVASWISNVN